ncbi:N-carbamoylputrescine amidase [Calycomorphotria hydatis]|uniref:N-carbamoyl-D-amino acid hydrolase n=1 Tax=Calycomorphotria hydatis TaxID=2528027 RepID=A0A517TF81_9PLAN|nr:N-carbamoylputrescine amidase [Calycomorphotria hydatis]QDT67030.1 N-carbamoyl-D-amino acid hydrolase [Calycomorphotria hydatis]
MSHMHVAALQLPLGGDVKTNVEAVSELIHKAATVGAKIILPPELFEGPYFCQTQSEEYFQNAQPVNKHPAVLAMQKLARGLGVYIPTSFFEADGPHYYNSLAMINDQGEVMGVYRKSHIPDGPGYTEKFYFRPGNTGFQVWATPYGNIGIGICWDQWYPETARSLMLMGADLLMFPTAIGDEPAAEELDTRRLWQRAMIGHAVSNVVPVVAANRIGNENDMNFYGHSFIADHRGDMVSELGSTETDIIHAKFDLELIKRHRAAFGFFRDRRPELYSRISTDH